MKKSWLDTIVVGMSIVLNFILTVLRMGGLIVMVLVGHLMHVLRKKR
ncbi:hypothetical protein ACKUSY_12660 [Myroides odoratus]